MVFMLFFLSSLLLYPLLFRLSELFSLFSMFSLFIILLFTISFSFAMLLLFSNLIELFSLFLKFSKFIKLFSLILIFPKLFELFSLFLLFSWLLFSLFSLISILIILKELNKFELLKLFTPSSSLFSESKSSCLWLSLNSIFPSWASLISFSSLGLKNCNPLHFPS